MASKKTLKVLQIFSRFWEKIL